VSSGRLQLGVFPMHDSCRPTLPNGARGSAPANLPIPKRSFSVPRQSQAAWGCAWWLCRFAVVVGIANASLHLLSSAYYQRWMPGVFSSPILLVSALFLFAAARHWKPVAGSSPLVGTS
jgi:hypothetical protein